MMHFNSISILGGDMRQVYLFSLFQERGYSVFSSGIISDKNDSLSHVLDKSHIILGPIPLTKDQKSIPCLIQNDSLTLLNLSAHLTPAHTLIAGNIPPAISSYCQEHRIPCWDLMKQNRLALANTVATAEGAIAEAISLSPINLTKSSALILGYGKCGKMLAHKLSAMDCFITICDQDKNALDIGAAYSINAIFPEELDATIGKFDFIFNTIPALVLPKDRIQKLKPDAVIIDIASASGGVDFEAAKENHILAKHCLGLPGKYSPKTSAALIADEIFAILSERI